MSKRDLIFVIHKHEARRLHWDLRLEMNGVLKSWAVPKEPPQNAGVRRLAIMVEDHPIEYANFQGIIPEGHYGAGKVEIWDKGTYEPIEVSDRKIVFKLYGSKLRGEYVLLKYDKSGENNWLFFKKS